MDKEMVKIRVLEILKEESYGIRGDELKSRLNVKKEIGFARTFGRQCKFTKKGVCY